MNRLVLGDSLDALLDHRGKTPKKLGGDFAPAGIPVASALLVRDGRLDLSGARYVSDEMYAKWMPERTRRGDVILTSEAPAGRVARVDTDDPLVLGQRLFCLRGKAGVLDSGFLYYALQSHAVQTSILGHSTGTTVVGIRQSALRLVQIPAPSFPEQQAIAEVLGALDDKIAANTALASTAESFSASIAATAPASIPLGSLAELSKQQLHPESLGDRFVDHFSLPAFDAGALPSTELASAIKSSKFVLTEESILLSKLNPRFPRVWRAAPASRPALASTEFLVLRSPEVTTRLLWASISDPTFAKALDARVAGTSGSHQRVKPADALTVKIRDPRALPERAQSLIEHVLRAASLAREESRTLAATRDALLPQLMSGKLRVRDAIRAAKEVV